MLNKPVIGNPAFVQVGTTGHFPSIYHDIYLGDFNGDGITDLLNYKSDEGWTIAYGNGEGMFTDIRPMPNIVNRPRTVVNPIPGSTSPLRPVIVGDFNGDGKSDIFDYTDSHSAFDWGTPHSPKIHYSKGNHNFETENEAGGYKWAILSGDYWVGDHNGDGKTDIYTKRSEVLQLNNISFHPGEKRHLISKITNGLGVSTKIEYKNLTDPSVYQPGSITYIYPFVKRTLPFNVVSKINLDNGIDSLGNDITYHYTGIKYNVHGKGLLGFDKLSTYDDINELTTEKHFTLNLDYAFPYLHEMFSYQGNYILHKTIADYTLHHYGHKRIFPYVHTNEQRDYVQNLFSRTEYKYTAPAGTQPHGYAFGRPNAVITRKGYTVGSAPSPVQKELTEQVFEYPELYNLLPAYIQNKAIKVITRNTRTGQPPFSDTQSFEYHPTRALLTLTKSKPGTNGMNTEFTYNSYGNLTYKTITATGLSPRTQAYLYDASNRFVTQTWNQAYPDVKTSTNYHFVSGDILSSTQPDGHKVDYTYDAFGRLKTATENTGAASTTGFYTGLGVSYWPSSAKYVTVTIPNTGGHQYNFYDRLHRLVRTASKGFNGQDILMDRKYNAKGQLYQSTKPYFEGHTPQTTTYSYDIRGRLVKESHPEGDIDYDYLIVGGDMVTTVTNTAGQEKKSTVDISGRLVKSEDHGGTLNYTYHSNGQVKEVSLSGSGVVAEYEYDDFGRKTKKIDPNYGSYEYTYNPFGELTSKKDPKGNIFNYTYDQGGYLTSKNGPDGYFTYTYHTGTGTNSGKLITLANMNTGEYIYYLYDKGDRIKYELRTGFYNNLESYFYYDSYGRPERRMFPNGKEIYYGYNTNDGSLSKISAMLMGSYHLELYSCIEKNEFAQTKVFGQAAPFGTLPYGMTTTRDYNQFGLLEEESSQFLVGPGPFRSLSYDFNPQTGNLGSRSDNYNDQNESFSYDNLNRLTHVQTTLPTNPPTGQLKQVIDYAPNGNILEKTDAGAFSYDPANRLSEIEPYVDIPTETQTLAYTPFNKVATIEEGNREAIFSYWPDEERGKMELIENGVPQKVKYYAPDFEREIIPSTYVTRDLCYIKGPEGNIIAIWETRNGVENMHYTLTDYLGNITHVIDQSGNIVEERSFDAWGRMRSASTWTEEPPTYGSMTDEGWDRGFTGHEHLPQFGIINMNGRLYDPVMGRMFSPDPYIQQTNNTQNYNRYSYVLNNPLKYTDPSGNLFFGTRLTAFVDFFRTGLTKGGFELWNWNSSHFQKAWADFDPGNKNSRTAKAFKIDLGMWTVDENRTFMGQVSQLFLRHTWEGAQTNLGKLVSHARNISGGVDNVDFYRGATLVNWNASGKDGWGLTLGPYINSQNIIADPNNDDLFRHEFGHTLQSKLVGPSYLHRIGLPSIVGSGLEALGIHNHNKEWYETQANRMAFRYLDKKTDVLYVRPWNEVGYPRNYNPNLFWLWSHFEPSHFWWIFF